MAYAPNGFIYVATEHAVWKIPYQTGDQSEANASAVQIAAVRQGGIPPGSDGDVHHTSSVAVSNTTVFVGVGSSCNACVEIDPTRATIQQMGLDGSNMTHARHALPQRHRAHAQPGARARSGRAAPVRTACPTATRTSSWTR